jgi:hypothetical protein
VERIIYDDEMIQVIWHAGNSDFVLITFGDLTMMANGTRFFADAPVKRLGISCVGIVAHSPNWYPYPSLMKALDVISAIIRPFSSRIIYGGSMGGYAAIKYSALFGATEVLSLCPQYSIDPADCEGHNPWGGWFNPSMRDMAIRPADIAGRHFLFYDPHNLTDLFHFERILIANPSVDAFTVPYVGHHVTSTFAGTQYLATLIAACRNADIHAIREFVRARRRYSRARLGAIIRHTADASPKTSAHLFEKLQSADPKMLAAFRYRELSAFLTSRVRTSLDSERSLDYLRQFIKLSNVPVEQAAAALHARAIGSQLIYVSTVHKTEIFFDPQSENLMHGTRRYLGYPFKLCFDLCGQEIEPFLDLQGHRIRLQIDGSGQITSRYAHASGAALTFLLEPAERGCFRLRHGKGFLSAESGGRLLAKPQTNMPRERFSLLV